jgi:hypothetical protein
MGSFVSHWPGNPTKGEGNILNKLFCISQWTPSRQTDKGDLSQPDPQITVPTANNTTSNGQNYRKGRKKEQWHPDRFLYHWCHDQPQLDEHRVSAQTWFDVLGGAPLPHTFYILCTPLQPLQTTVQALVWPHHKEKYGGSEPNPHY